MTGTGESLADTHIHMNRHMEAGGATLGFTVLWYYPVLLPDRRPAARREWEGGERHSTSRLERDARKKAQPSLPPFFSDTQTPHPLQTCHSETNMLASDHELIYFNVYAQFHIHPRGLSFFRGQSILPRIIHSQNHTAKHCAAYITSSSTWNTCTFTLQSSQQLRLSGCDRNFLLQRINMDAFAVS